MTDRNAGNGRKGRTRTRGNRGARGITVVPPALPTKLTAEDRAKIDAIGDAVDLWIGNFDLGRETIAELVLRDVFGQDAHAMARADRRSNPKFAALLETIDARGRISADAFTTVVRIVAFDHLLVAPYRYWRRLKPPVKERFLPLADDLDTSKRAQLQQFDEAAKHAVDFDLGRDAAADYVRELKRKAGKTPRRNATYRTYDRRLEQAIDTFATDDGLARLEKVCDDLPAEKVDELQEKLRKAGEALLAAAKRAKGRGKKQG